MVLPSQGIDDIESDRGYNLLLRPPSDDRESHGVFCTRWHLQRHHHRRRGNVSTSRSVWLHFYRASATPTRLLYRGWRADGYVHIANTPHNPCRYADTVGIVIERVRPEGAVGQFILPRTFVPSLCHSRLSLWLVSTLRSGLMIGFCRSTTMVLPLSDPRTATRHPRSLFPLYRPRNAAQAVDQCTSSVVLLPETCSVSIERVTDELMIGLD